MTLFRGETKPSKHRFTLRADHQRTSLQVRLSDVASLSKVWNYFRVQERGRSIVYRTANAPILLDALRRATSLSPTCKGYVGLLKGLKTVFRGLFFTPKLPWISGSKDESHLVQFHWNSQQRALLTSLT